MAPSLGQYRELNLLISLPIDNGIDNDLIEFRTKHPNPEIRR